MTMPSYDPPKPSPQEIALQQEQLALMREQREYMAKQQLIQEQERARLQLETAETAADAARMGSQANRYGEQGPFRMVSMPYGGFLVNGQNRSEGSGVRRNDPGPTGFSNPAQKNGDSGLTEDQVRDMIERDRLIRDMEGLVGNSTPELRQRIGRLIDSNPAFRDYLTDFVSGKRRIWSAQDYGGTRWAEQ